MQKCDIGKGEGQPLQVQGHQHHVQHEHKVKAANCAEKEVADDNEVQKDGDAGGDLQKEGDAGGKLQKKGLTVVVAAAAADDFLLQKKMAVNDEYVHKRRKLKWKFQLNVGQLLQGDHQYHVGLLLQSHHQHHAGQLLQDHHHKGQIQWGPIDNGTVHNWTEDWQCQTT